MGNIESQNIRSFGLVGHGNSGKTILTDAILHHEGLADRVGSVENGTTQSDWTQQEQEREFSIDPGLFHLTRNDHRIHLLDLPGYPDFIGHALAGIHAVDLVGVCVDAESGIMVNTRKVWEKAQNLGKSCCILINKLDQEDGDYFARLEELQDGFDANIVPYTIPDQSGEDFSEVYNLLDDPEELPETLQDRTAAHREELIESAVETDEDLMEKFFMDEDLSRGELNTGLRNAMLQEDLVPVLCTSGKEELGIEPLLEFVEQAGPRPSETNVPDATITKEVEKEVEPDEDSDDEEEVETEIEIQEEPLEIAPSEDGPLYGQVFRIVSDQFLGTLSFTRIYSGRMDADDPVEVGRTDSSVTPGNLLFSQGEEQEEVTEATTGDIVGIPEIDDVEVGDTIRDPSEEGEFVKPGIQDPMVSLAIEPKSKGDEKSLFTALQELELVDPTFKKERNEETNELIIRGVSNLHLEVVLARLKNQHDVEVETSPPQIPYRETITQEAQAKHRHKKQSGGRGQFAEVYLRIKPLPRGEGFDFRDQIRGAAIPSTFIPAVEKGIQNTMEEGIVAGFPIQDVAVEVYDGDDHPVDSSEEAFKVAGAKAFEKAFQDAMGILLEPIVNLEVTVPRDYMGDITGDLNSRRARIEGMDAEGDEQTIHAKVPLSEVLTYEPQLRSLTGGEGVYEIEHSHYQKVPSSVKKEIMKKIKRKED